MVSDLLPSPIKQYHVTLKIQDLTFVIKKTKRRYQGSFASEENIPGDTELLCKTNLLIFNSFMTEVRII